MNKKKILKNVFSGLLYQVIAMVYAFIIPRLIIKNFGSNVNGLVSSITQFLSYITLLEFGIGPIIKNALFKPIVEKDKKSIEDILGTVDKFFKRIAYIFIGYIILLVIFYPLLISGKFSFLYTVSLIIIISLSQFFEYYLGITYRLFIRSDQKDYIIDYINSFGYIVNLVLIIILIKLNCSIQIVKLFSTVIFVLKPILLKIYFDKKYGYKINKNSKYKLTKQYDGLIHHIATVVQNNTNVLILTIFSNLINVSIYAVYALVTNGLRQVIQAFTNGIDAFFGKLMVNGKKSDIYNKFKVYTFVYHTVSTIILACALVLVTPFVSIYTKDITDANYVLPVFGYLMILTEYNFIIRLPYSSLTYAKGDFRETRVFSLVEPIVDVILSVILVINYGLIGVAIGSLIALLIRSFGFIIYVAKKILKVKSFDLLKIIFVSYVEIFIVLGVHIYFGNYLVNNYFEWILYAMIVFIIITVFILLINALLFKNVFKVTLNSFITRRKKVNE